MAAGFDAEAQFRVPTPDELAPERVWQQEELIRGLALVSCGSGPGATGSLDGWRLARDLYFRCLRCGYYMASTANLYDTCYCGAMHRDVDAGRFGSQFGDDAIEVFRAE